MWIVYPIMHWLLQFLMFLDIALWIFCNLKFRLPGQRPSEYSTDVMVVDALQYFLREMVNVPLVTECHTPLLYPDGHAVTPHFSVRHLDRHCSPTVLNIASFVIIVVIGLVSNLCPIARCIQRDLLLQIVERSRSILGRFEKPCPLECSFNDAVIKLPSISTMFDDIYFKMLCVGMSEFTPHRLCRTA